MPVIRYWASHCGVHPRPLTHTPRSSVPPFPLTMTCPTPLTDRHYPPPPVHSLVDTKVMGSTQPFRDLIPATSLGEMATCLDTHPFTMPQIGESRDSYVMDFECITSSLFEITLCRSGKFVLEKGIGEFWAKCGLLIRWRYGQPQWFRWTATPTNVKTSVVGGGGVTELTKKQKWKKKIIHDWVLSFTQIDFRALCYHRAALSWDAVYPAWDAANTRHKCTGACRICYGTHWGQTILSSSARSMANWEIKLGALDPHHRELEV